MLFLYVNLSQCWQNRGDCFCTQTEWRRRSYCKSRWFGNKTINNRKKPWCSTWLSFKHGTTCKLSFSFMLHAHSTNRPNSEILDCWFNQNPDKLVSDIKTRLITVIPCYMDLRSTFSTSSKMCKIRLLALLPGHHVTAT